MTPTPGQIVIIKASNVNFQEAIARVDRISDRSGMVYLTDSKGGDRVCYSDELEPSGGVTITKPASVVEPKGKHSFFTDYAARNAK